ncbi:hypothetical protein BU14_2656s0001, partial [Porphyra umbilicalis]
MGMKNHELVPTPLIASLAGLRGGGVARCLSTLHRHSLVHRERALYEGYRLTTLGYDYLAMHALQRRGALLAVGRVIGVGKEADVLVCTSSAGAYAAGKAGRDADAAADGDGDDADDDDGDASGEDGGDGDGSAAGAARSVAPTADGDGDGAEADADRVAVAMKVHRLGRTSFRAVKSKRDYLRPRQSAGSWMYLSRLAAVREFAFLSALYARGFPVPVPVAANRHIVVMELVPGTPLHQVRAFEAADGAATAGRALVRFCADLAAAGLVHCDLNEHNVMVGLDDDQRVTVIDFPQVVSVGHRCAREWWERDVGGVRDFFGARFGVAPDELLPEITWAAVVGDGEGAAAGRGRGGDGGAVRIDDALKASGFDRDVLSQGALVPGAVAGAGEEWEWRQADDEDSDEATGSDVADDDADDVGGASSGAAADGGEDANAASADEGPAAHGAAAADATAAAAAAAPARRRRSTRS